MKKILTFFMATVVAMSIYALPQENLSAKKALAGFEKANVENSQKAKVEKKRRMQAMAHDFVRPAQTKKAAAGIAPKQHTVAEGQTINMPMYFNAGPEYYEEYGDWFITLENDDWWMLKLDWYAPQGENNDGYVGTFTLDDFDLSNTYFIDPDYEYVDVEDITLEITKVKVDDVTARIELKATVLGSDGNTYVVTAEKEVVEPKETIVIEIKDANYAWNADDALGVLTAKNDQLDLSLTIEAWWATGPFSLNEVMQSSVKYDGVEVELASLDMLISTGKNAEEQVGYIIALDMISTDAIMYSVSLFAPLVATETVEIAINNLEIDESGAFDSGWIFLNGSNDEWDLSTGIYGPWTMEEGTFRGQDEVIFWLTNKETYAFTEQLYAELVVTNDPQYGWVVTIESFCTDNKVYHVTMKKDLASATDTVLIRYENSAIAQYYPHLKHDLLLANSNDLYYVGIDIVNVAMGESFTKANLDLEYSGIITNYGDKANQKWVDMADVQGKVYQEGDTTIIEALILSFDNVLYDVQLWYCVPTPTETVQVEIEATFDNNIQMEGYYKISGYNKENTLHIALAPITEEVEGTFVNDGKFSSFGEGQYDFYYNETAVYKNINGRAVQYSIEKCTMNVTVAENGDMTVLATIIAADAVQYEVIMTSKYNEYLDYDATHGAIDRTYNATDSVLLETYDNDNAAYMEIMAADGSDLCALYFIVEDFDDAITIQPGAYTISKSLDAMTVLASVGAVDNSPYPSFYAKQNAQGQLVAPLYFLVGGTVTVEKVDGKMKLEVNAVNSYDVPVHIVYDATQGTGSAVENVKLEVKAVKMIKNSQLIINREGKMYNAQGAQVK
jgi:hypothetical protein